MAGERTNLQSLVVALVNAVRAQGGSVTKTRLIKLLYLADVAYYRSKGMTLTGFNWIFHLYGPWTHEFDALLSRMEIDGLISIVPWKHPEGEACLIQTDKTVVLDSVVGDLEADYEIKRHIENFGTKPLGELLNYVYFETEPMAGAERGSALDLTRVDRSRKFRPYKRNSSTPMDRKKIAALRERLSKNRRPQLQGFIQPRYDEEYFQMMKQLDADD